MTMDPGSSVVDRPALPGGALIRRQFTALNQNFFRPVIRQHNPQSGIKQLLIRYW